jgi:hypothetical protein
MDQIEFHLNKLPDGHREKALFYYNREVMCGGTMPLLECNSVSNALTHAFDWDKTEEGAICWAQIRKAYDAFETKGINIPKLPPILQKPHGFMNGRYGPIEIKLVTDRQAFELFNILEEYSFEGIAGFRKNIESVPHYYTGCHVIFHEHKRINFRTVPTLNDINILLRYRTIIVPFEKFKIYKDIYFYNYLNYSF